MLRVEALHAAVFGRHFHPCPTEYCGGALRPCSLPYDCQDEPVVCSTCRAVEEAEYEEREVNYGRR